MTLQTSHCLRNNSEGTPSENCYLLVKAEELFIREAFGVSTPTMVCHTDTQLTLTTRLALDTDWLLSQHVALAPVKAGSNKQNQSYSCHPLHSWYLKTKLLFALKCFPWKNEEDIWLSPYLKKAYNLAKFISWQIAFPPISKPFSCTQLTSNLSSIEDKYMAQLF